MLDRNWRRFEPVALSVLSGFLLTCAFPRTGAAAAAWVALIPLLVAVRGKPWGEAFRLGYWCGLSHALTSLYWIYHVMALHSGLSVPLAVVVLLLLCLYIGCYPACFAALSAICQRRSWVWLWGIPAVWVALEWVRAYMISGFPWNNLGYSQTPFLAFIQIADITGVYGLSWLLVLVNTCLTRVWVERRLHWSLLIVAVLVVLVSIYGKIRLDGIEALERQAPVMHVALIQGNIDQTHKWDPAFQEKIVNRYLELSREAAASTPRPSLLVWPETAAPFFLGLEDRFTPLLEQLAQSTGAALVVGAPGVGKENGQSRYYNRVFLLDTQGKILGKYTKQHLVPFGEYVPLARVFFFLQRLVESAGDFSPGTDARPLTLDGQHFGALICYEAIFPALARQSVHLGANVLINVTNDAWYGVTSAPYQHLEMARWRAIENRVPLIRCANTGISTVFSASGHGGPPIPLNETGYRVYDVAPLHVATFYNRYGDWFPWLCCLTAFAAFVYSLARVRTGVAEDGGSV
jgi:apolipoprotein N-acyltransferase